MTTRRTILTSAAGAIGAAALAPAPAAAARAGFSDRVAGALYGFAIGDAMGGPVEGWRPAEVRERFADHDFTQFIGPTKPELIGTGKGKGDGRFTDDMLGLEALIRVYEGHRDHLDAFAYAKLFAYEIAERKVWVPETQDERFPLDRPLWWPERYFHHRNVITKVDPRLAGVGNRTNGGLMAIVLPTGVVNAGDPDGGYAEVIAFGAAHQESYALEAAAVAAAGYAAAFSRGATIGSVIETMRRLAKDGTKVAIEAALEAIDAGLSLDDFVDRFWRAYLPFSGLTPAQMEDPDAYLRDGRDGTQVELPSRIASVEHAPAVAAVLLWGGGDYLKTLKASILLGRDCETIAAIAGGMVGALHGKSAIPQTLRAVSDHANRRDQNLAARRLAAVAKEVFAKDRRRLSARESAL